LVAFGFACLGRDHILDFKFQGRCELRGLAINSSAGDFKSSHHTSYRDRLNFKLASLARNVLFWTEAEDTPTLISSVPVDWDYHGEEFNLNFRAGINGVSKDPSDGTLAPVMRSFVSHDINPHP
jgi:hypothetical protein